MIEVEFLYKLSISDCHGFKARQGHLHPLTIKALCTAAQIALQTDMLLLAGLLGCPSR
jgi:hypothetical protein